MPVAAGCAGCAVPTAGDLFVPVWQVSGFSGSLKECFSRIRTEIVLLFLIIQRLSCKPVPGFELSQHCRLPGPLAGAAACLLYRGTLARNEGSADAATTAPTSWTLQHAFTCMREERKALRCANVEREGTTLQFQSSSDTAP